MIGKDSMKHYLIIYSRLSIEDITGYVHTKRVYKVLKTKNLGEYHDLYVLSDILLLADVFENLQNMSWNMWTWSCKISFNGMPLLKD